MVVDHLRHYLLHNKFIIHTDQRSLIHLNEQRLHTAWQQKVFCKLMGLCYRVHYRRGLENGAADALSRHGPPAELLPISSPTHDWLHELVQWYDTDSEAQTLLSQLVLDSSTRPPFEIHQGIIRYKGCIWLGSNTHLQQQVIAALHESPVGGHSGVPVTFQKIHKLFYSPKMRTDIWAYVQSCSVCAQDKLDRAKYPGLLSPLPVPRSSWEHISMDFVEGLPTSGHANAIMVVVDRYSKFAHFIALHHPFLIASVSRLFIDNIYRLYCMPLSVVSDRARVFTSKFWQLFFSMASTTLCMSSTYHPQKDGQTECVNQSLETYLHCFVHACPSC
jgi:hypothetical protein